MPLVDLSSGIRSPHFLVVSVPDDADALARAKAIAATCEQDLKTLESWFRCDFGKSEFGIIVTVYTGKHLGGASNRGWPTDQSAQIDILGTYAPPGGPANATLRDEMARMIFVAELAEVLMDFTLSAWDRGDSMGEGLSIVAAQTLHPTGYYATGQGPRIQTWLNGTRPDFITNSEETDTNSVSYGCATLFINYLRYQLGFSFESIIAAAGSFQVLAIPGLTKTSLASVFSKLTGRPAASAFKEFTDLLKAHIPVGQTYTPTRDNLFPLWTANQRSVSFSPQETELNPVVDKETLFTKLKPGPLCPPDIYSYHNVNLSSQLMLTGKTVGYAQPTFSWAVNGTALPAAKNWQAVTLSFTATDTIPGIGEAPFATTLNIQYLIAVSGYTSTLKIRNFDFPGNGALNVSLAVSESLVNGDVPTTFTDSSTILTRRYSMDGRWSRAVASCNIKDFGMATETLKGLAHRMVADENRPNPNPALVRALAAAANQVVSALDALTHGSRGLDSAVMNSFMELAAVHAPLEAVIFTENPSGLRMGRKVEEVAVQIPLGTNETLDSVG